MLPSSRSLKLLVVDGVRVRPFCAMRSRRAISPRVKRCDSEKKPEEYSNGEWDKGSVKPDRELEVDGVTLAIVLVAFVSVSGKCSVSAAAAALAIAEYCLACR